MILQACIHVPTSTLPDSRYGEGSSQGFAPTGYARSHERGALIVVVARDGGALSVQLRKFSMQFVSQAWKKLVPWSTASRTALSNPFLEPPSHAAPRPPCYNQRSPSFRLRLSFSNDLLQRRIRARARNGTQNQRKLTSIDPRYTHVRPFKMGDNQA